MKYFINNKQMLVKDFYKHLIESQVIYDYNYTYDYIQPYFLRGDKLEYAFKDHTMDFLNYQNRLLVSILEAAEYDTSIIGTRYKIDLYPLDSMLDLMQEAVKILKDLLYLE